jgi:transcriptional repressor NrdR
MRCPYCSETRDRVVDSRESRDGATIRRRRECLACGRRFTSYEQIEDIPYMVVKRDGTRHEYSRKKLLAGLYKACEKRPVPARELERVADAVEGLLHDREERELSTQQIGAYLMERLRELDQVAYVRFASVYRRFEDVDAFMDVLRGLAPAGATAEVPKAGRRAAIAEPAAGEPESEPEPAGAAKGGR